MNRPALPATEDDREALKAALAAAQAQLEQAGTVIAHLKLVIAKMQRERFGARSERSARLSSQMELQLEELEAAATEDELAAEMAAAPTTAVRAFERKRPARNPFPEHLPRERIVIRARPRVPAAAAHASRSWARM